MLSLFEDLARGAAAIGIFLVGGNVFRSFSLISASLEPPSLEPFAREWRTRSRNGRKRGITLNLVLLLRVSDRARLSPKSRVAATASPAARDMSVFRPLVPAVKRDFFLLLTVGRETTMRAPRNLFIPCSSTPTRLSAFEAAVPRELAHGPEPGRQKRWRSWVEIFQRKKKST